MPPEELALIGMRYFTRWMLRAGYDSRLGRAGYLSRLADRSMMFPTKNLQHELKHASNFDKSIFGNWNKAKGQEFQKALEAHVSNPKTLVISGTYRGEPATRFLDPRTGLNVVRDANGNLIAAYRLGPQQPEGVLRWGRLW